MSMTDPIADMLTRIRNAIQARHAEVTMPASKVKAEIAKILKEEGYIKDFATVKAEKFNHLKVTLKYSASKESSISNIKRVSKPGLRKYVGKDELPRILNGLGGAIMSTSGGLLSDKKAKELGVGGEILCTVY